VLDVLIAMAISLQCGHLRDGTDNMALCDSMRIWNCGGDVVETCEKIFREDSLESCRLQLNKCIYDDKHGFVDCMRSMNQGRK
jgi:hypothetical protein